ncbi:MAG TPA: lysophospholipid acyltransferase family protein [Candidatus Angelobacter sp.]|nr:lysophospholipid acyltransferase family protein [Candidatus Angelobacter sp.]
MSGIEPHPPAFLKAGLQATTALTRALGPLRYPLADALGMAGYALSGRRRRNAALNHRRLDPGISMAEARRRARRSFREFARTGIDFVWACGFDPEATRRHSTWPAGQAWNDEVVGYGGGIFALTHFGSWDMAANIAFASRLNLTTVMATTGPRAITDLVVWARRANQMEVYEASHAAMGMVKAIRRGRFVAILCDLPEDGPTVTVDYCGGPVPFSSVPAWLALRTKGALFPTACWRDERGVYQLHPMGPVQLTDEDDAQSVMQKVADTIEPLVRAHPGQWYPFRQFYADGAAAPTSREMTTAG